MTGRAAAQAIETSRYQPEEYAHSVVNVIRWGGELAVRGGAERPERGGLYEQNFDDYASGLREMLRTDREFSEVLDIDDQREHKIVDGRARAADGRAMVDIVAEGRRGSEKLAADYEEWEPQAIRDAGDEIIAKGADALAPGQALFAVSLNPNQALKDYPDLYKRLGYRDLSYVQYYAKTNEGVMVAGSYSVDASDEATWRRLFADRGLEVPEDVDENTFSRQTFELTATPEEAEQTVRDMRADYYDRRGIDHQRYSVSEYLEHHQATAQAYFDAYYPSLAKAADSRENNEVMRGFALTLLDAKISRLKPEIKQTLIKVANSSGFDYEAAKVMDSVIRYAVVEELRKGLPAYVHASPTPRPAESGPGAGFNGVPSVPGVHLALMNNQLAENVSSGVEAGRDYGGCPGQVELSDADESGITGIAGLDQPQNAYGGRGRGRRSRSLDDDCEYTSKKCPLCGEKDVKTKVTRVNGRKHVEGACGCSKTY